jgi:O-antigen ligase
MFPLILLYVVLTIIRPQSYMASLANVPLLIVVLFAAFLSWMGSRAKTFDAPQFVLLPLFLLAMMASEVATGWFGGALEQLRQFGPAVIAFVVLAAAASVSRGRVKVTFAVFTLCTTVLALHGIDQARYGVGWTGRTLDHEGRITYVGIFDDPNDLGLLFVTVLPMAFYLSGGGGLLRRLFWLAAAGLILYGIYLTDSRGTMLAVAVVFTVYLWLTRGKLTALVFGGAGLIAMRMIKTRFQDLAASGSSALGRIDAWYAGLHMFLSHPLLGVGVGNFTDYNYLTAHNSLVLVLAETGFIGYTLWLAFVGYCFWMMVNVLRHQPDLDESDEPAAMAWRQEQSIAFTLLLCLCGMFAAAFFLSRSYIILVYLLAAIVVGAYVGCQRRFEDLPRLTLAEGWWRWPPIAMASIGGLYVIVKILLHSA